MENGNVFARGWLPSAKTAAQQVRLLPMTNEQRLLLGKYFDCVAGLQAAQMIRSDKVLGDLAEWICAQRYALILATSGRNPGYDGKIGDSKVQVKAHNSPKGTNLNVGDPQKYDEVLVLIGPNSRLRVGPAGKTFHVYRFSSSYVQHQFKRASGFYCAKNGLMGMPYDTVDIGDLGDANA